MSILIGLIVALVAAQVVAAPPEVEVVVGSLLPAEGGPEVTPASPLRSPFGVDVDPQGRLVIVELEGGRVHRLQPDGQVITIAGNGQQGYEGDGGPASKAVFNGMHNVAVTRAGDILIADSWNHCIRRIDPRDNTITTIAGTGQPGLAGDGRAAREAQFDFVMCVTLTADEDELFIADINNHRIRAMQLKTGNVRTVAGNGEQGVPEDGSVALDSPLVDPRAVAVDSKGNVYVLERSGHALRVVKPDGKIYTVAGTGTAGDRDGPAVSAELRSPKHLCVDAQDRVLIADESNGLVRLYDPVAKTLTTVLGRGESRPPVKLSMPHGVCCDDGWLYVVDTGHERILRMKW